MLYLLSVLCLVKRRTVSHTHRTSRSKRNKSDDVHRYAYRTAKDCPVFRVAFGCFFDFGYYVIHCRSPPYSSHFNLIGIRQQKKKLKKFLLKSSRLGYKCALIVLGVAFQQIFDDSKSIQKFLCIQENMDKLGSYAMRDRIDILLWDTQKAYKKEFNICWNKNWKNKLKALEKHLL